METTTVVAWGVALCVLLALLWTPQGALARVYVAGFFEKIFRYFAKLVMRVASKLWGDDYMAKRLRREMQRQEIEDSLTDFLEDKLYKAQEEKAGVVEWTRRDVQYWYREFGNKLDLSGLLRKKPKNNSERKKRVIARRLQDIDSNGKRLYDPVDLPGGKTRLKAIGQKFAKQAS